MNLKKLTNLFFELKMLQNYKHNGFLLINALETSSIAEHSLRAAQIAYFLAKMEKHQNPEKIVTMVVFHDMHEARTNDTNKVVARYAKVDEKLAFKEQTHDLAPELLQLWKETDEQTSIEGIIAKDADLLENALEAKELMLKGYKDAESWITVIETKLKTKSAKKILNEIKNYTGPWWKGLKKYQ